MHRLRTYLPLIRTIPSELGHLPRSVKMISLVVFTYFLAWGLTIPFLPIHFENVLGAYGLATFVVALLHIFRIVWAPPIGEFVDRFSKKKLIQFALFFYIPLWPFLAVIRTLGHFFLFRIYHSFFATAFWSSATTYARVHAPERHKSETMGLYGSASVLSIVVGSVIGGMLLFVMDIPTLIATVPVFLIIIAIFVSKRIPDQEPSLSFKESIKSIDWKNLYRKELRDFLNNRTLRRFIPLVLILGYLDITQGVLIPLFSSAINATFLEIGIIYALFAFPLLFEAPFGVLADMWSRKLLLTLGGALTAASLVGIFFVQNPIFLFPLAFLLGLGFAAMVPVVEGSVTEAVPTEHAGELNAGYNITYDVGGVIGLVLMGPIADAFSIRIPFLIGGVVMAVFMFFALLRGKFLD